MPGGSSDGIDLIVAIAVLILPGLGAARTASVNPDQPNRLDSMKLLFGVIAAKILRGHPHEHQEQTVHGGVPRGKGAHR